MQPHRQPRHGGQPPYLSVRQCQSIAKAAEPPRAPKGEIRALDTESLRELLGVAKGTNLYAPILIAVTTGLRRGELLGLKWSDIDLTDRFLHVRRSVEQVRGDVRVKAPKTEKSSRKVTLPRITVTELQRHSLLQKKDRLRLGPIYSDADWVFSREDGAIWNPDTFTRAFRRLLRDSKLDSIRFHDLRHTHATQLLKDGIFIKVVSERLGHSSVQITLDTYAHVLPSMQDEAAERIDSAISDLLRNSNG